MKSLIKFYEPSTTLNVECSYLKKAFFYTPSNFALAYYAALPNDAPLGTQPSWNLKNGLALSAQDWINSNHCYVNHHYHLINMDPLTKSINQ